MLTFRLADNGLGTLGCFPAMDQLRHHLAVQPYHLDPAGRHFVAHLSYFREALALADHHFSKDL